MAIAQVNVKGWLKLVCVLLFVFGVIIPCLLLTFAGNGLENPRITIQHKTATLRSHERKPLDFPEAHESADALKFQISELENIRVSVRNELRVMDRDRLRLSGELEAGRESLAGVKKEIEKAKVELQNTKSKLSRAARQVKRSTDSPPSVSSPGLLVVVNLPSRNQNLKSRRENEPAQNKQVFCTTEYCFDFSKCPLHGPFLVYVYNEHQPYSDQFLLKEQHLLKGFLSRLRQTNTLTRDPSLACVFVMITGPLSQPMSHSDLEKQVHSLPEWTATQGTNHLLIDLPYLAERATLLRDIDSGRALLAHGVASSARKQENSLLLPPVSLGYNEPSWQGLPPHLPPKRLHLVYFEGQQSEIKVCSDLMASDLKSIAGVLTNRTEDKVIIKTSCVTVAIGSDHALPGEWLLCGSADDRRSQLISATFSLVFGCGGSGLSGAHTYTRLVEALRYGAIPVIVGVAQLPLDAVIDWRLAAVILSPSQIGQLHLVLKSLRDETLLSIRRQGRFLWETYFSSPAHMVDSVISVVRSKFGHPPPVAMEMTQLSHLISIPGGNRQVPSPSFQHNFTIYTSELWNSPPGPFFLYPSSPSLPPPVSGSQYVGLNDKQLYSLPQHIVDAGGITGPDFEDYLLGNVPEEQFTVVILTYERNDVLIQALDRLSDLDSLSKVIVVWNNPSPPASDMQWPDIGVPLEVVSVGKNSLNNRFLPFPFIETEAVLSIDDDVHLRHDEIQFAFRVWREARDRVVGFPGRFHAYDVRHPGKWLYNSNYTCELSMVLTGAAFLHKYYLYLYSQWMPQEVRSIVDNFMNCEDIAMNFLVSHISRKPPLKVTSRWTFRCPGCPDTLSTSNEHFNERHICINKFTEIFGYVPLLYTQFRVDSVLFKTRLPSHLDKCYQFV